LCGDLGSVTIKSVAGASYSIDNGLTWQSSNVFNNLNGGSVSGIIVKLGDCTSPTADCSVSDCSFQLKSGSTPTTETITHAQSTKIAGSLPTEDGSSFKGIETIIAKIDSKTLATAGPNPFSDRIRFALQSGISGKGSLDLYNILGQKVKTVFEGYVEAGKTRNIEYFVPASQRTNLTWVFTVATQKVSGKLIGMK
jgi:hypothetical protein